MVNYPEFLERSLEGYRQLLKEVRREIEQKEYNARGIPLKRTCVQCHTRMMDGYRADVITNPNYWADEAIEED